MCHLDNSATEDKEQGPHAELDQEQLNYWAVLSVLYHDCHSRTKSPFYAGQTVSVLNDAKTFWLPATVIRQADHGSYLVEVISGGRYRQAQDHICEWHPKAKPMKKDMSSPGNVAPATPEWPGAPPVQKPLAMQKSPPVPKSPPVKKVPVQQPLLHLPEHHSRPVQPLLPHTNLSAPVSHPQGLQWRCDHTMNDADLDHPWTTPCWLTIYIYSHNA